MKLMRVGETERPAAVDADGVMRDLSGVVADIGPAFFAGDGLRRAAEAIDHGGLPEARGRIGSRAAPVGQRGQAAGRLHCRHDLRRGLPDLVPQPVHGAEPGDLLNTGTPADAALGRADQPYLRPGDHVELQIDRLGRAGQRVVAAS